MPLFKRVFHPSDFSAGDESAFVHALKIALAARGELSLLHVDPPAGHADWSEFPRVRDTLERWGSLPSGASRDSLREIGLEVKKIMAHAVEPGPTICRHIADEEPDLVVLATHQRAGFTRLLYRSIAEPVARQSHATSLFVPRRVVGFVSPESGRVRLENIVIPIDRRPDPTLAAEAACRLIRTLGCPRGVIRVIYAGEEADAPDLSIDPPPGWSIDRTVWSGPVVEHILDVCEDQHADLVVMATLGHRGFLDALRGSTTEQVLHAVRCPLLAVPAM